MKVNDFFALAPRKVTPTHTHKNSPPFHKESKVCKSPDLKHDTYKGDERGRRFSNNDEEARGKT
jgi:hypothetical protein